MHKLATRTLLVVLSIFCLFISKGVSKQSEKKYITDENKYLLGKFSDVQSQAFTNLENEMIAMKKRLLINSQVNESFSAAVHYIRTLPQIRPIDAVTNVLMFMSTKISYAPDKPFSRGPHEWDGKQCMLYGSTNGCVEAAKVFFELFRAVYPEYKALYIDSFNSDCSSGGHAVVEVIDSNGSAFIVNTASYVTLPSIETISYLSSGLKEGDVTETSSLNGRKYIGKIIQLHYDSDIHVRKEKGKYYATYYEYSHVFDGKVKGESVFETLSDLNKYLLEYLINNTTDEELLKKGIILKYDDTSKTSFSYYNPCGKQPAKYVVYGCYKKLPDKDIAEKIEPVARQEYKDTREVTSCNRVE